ncbi:MAG: peptidoglycan DD-metalloendopeptidase family protein [Tenacibaculum sp.]|nr:peptidoglycan DD-metalloendopeptidase family protein [Tenacibaculum sp.]
MKKYTYILLFSFLLIGLSAFSQKSRKQLENERKKLHQEIKKVEKILSQTKKKKNNALENLKDLNRKITIRKRFIQAIESEVKELSKEIEDNQKKIEDNNSELKLLKDDYANMVFKSYKGKHQQSEVMFILSSKSFYQAYKRLKYIQQYKDFRRKQAENIITKTNNIKDLNNSLKEKKNDKTKLLSSKAKEKKKIELDRKNKKNLISKIKRQESKYKRQLKQKLKEERRIVAKIDKIIRDAIARANRKKKGSKTNKLLLSKAEKALKVKFEQNKGRLPWPIDNGIITRKFGVQRHPTFSGITINSTGIHIRGKRGDEAKSIFTGKVLAVQLLSKGRKSVFIQHGNYITVYNNIEKVYVKKGQSVKTGQKLGMIFTDKVTGKTSLGFVLSRNTKKLNPTHWIRRK